MSFETEITLFHHLICLILSLLTFLFSARVVFNKTLLLKSLKFCPVISIYIVFLFIWACFTILNSTHLILLWRLETNVYNAYLLYWFGCFPYILNHMGTVLEIFMCIDRCISTLLPMTYSSNCRIYFCIVTVLSLIGFVLVFLHFNPLHTLIPKDEITPCRTFGCLLVFKQYGNLFQTKLSIIFTNTAGGIILFALVKTRLKAFCHAANRRICKNLLIVIASSTCFEISPTLIALVIDLVSCW